MSSSYPGNFNSLPTGLFPHPTFLHYQCPLVLNPVCMTKTSFHLGPAPRALEFLRWSGPSLCLLPRSCGLVVFSVLRLPVNIVKAQGAQLPVGPGPHLYLMVVDCSITLLNSSLKTCSQSAISARAGSLILSCASYYYFVFYAPSAKAH